MQINSQFFLRLFASRKAFSAPKKLIFVLNVCALALHPAFSQTMPSGNRSAELPARAAIAYSTNTFREEDYPARARIELAQGVARASYLIGVDGKVEECVIVESSGHEQLDLATCQVILSRFRFISASSGGRRVTERKVQPVRWSLRTPTATSIASSNVAKQYGQQSQSPPAITSQQPNSDTGKAQQICSELGFARGTQPFADCALQVYQQATQQRQESQAIANYQSSLDRKAAGASRRREELMKSCKWKRVSALGQWMQLHGFAGADNHAERAYRACLAELPPPEIPLPVPVQRRLNPQNFNCTRNLDQVTCHSF